MSNRVSTILKHIKHKFAYQIKAEFPKWLANRLYKKQFHRDINWKNPTEFNEKLRWLQFNTDTSKWILLADKYRVREYLETKGYGDLLVKLYGVWDNAEDIDFSTLPDSFVIKTNNGSGSVYIIRDKHIKNLEQIRFNLKKDLTANFGISTAEPHYLRIKPVIIAEELLEQDGDISSSLIDYKMFCTNGEAQFCGVMYNRNIQKHTYEMRLYDKDWKEVDNFLKSTSNFFVGCASIPRPKNFVLMKNFCNDICKEFPFVRMDFYECNGKLYFGEFTFTPDACTGGALGKEVCKILADKIVFPQLYDDSIKI